MKSTAYPVSTKVIDDQARTTLRDLKSPANAARVASLARYGIDDAFVARLNVASEGLAAAEVMQEQSKASAAAEAKEDQALAARGYRWKLALDASVRAYIAAGGDKALGARFRFGKLKNKNARSVVYELRVVLPEADAVPQLKGFGVDDAFLQQGRDILEAMIGSRQETTDAVNARKATTAEVARRELEVSQLLAQLVAADEAHCLRSPGDGPVFRVDLIRAELARLDAARAARVAARHAEDDEDDA